MKGAWLVVLLSLAYVGVSRRAPACSPPRILSPATVLSPTLETFHGVGTSFLIRDRAAAGVAFLDFGLGERSALELQQVFDPLRPPFAPPFAFYRPAQPLLADYDYVLRSESEVFAVLFRAAAETPRVSATFGISVVSRTVPEDELSSTACYSGPLADRPFTRVADVVVESTPATRFVVSVTTLDAVSGQLIEDAGASNEDGEVRLEFPLPSGVADCLRVQVLDFAGTAVADEGSLCVTPQGDKRSVSAEVFEAIPAPPRDFAAPRPVEEEPEPVEAEPNEREPDKVSRTSKGCEVSSRGGGSGSGLGILLLSALGLTRRARGASASGKIV